MLKRFTFNLDFSSWLIGVEYFPDLVGFNRSLTFHIGPLSIEYEFFKG